MVGNILCILIVVQKNHTQNQIQNLLIFYFQQEVLKLLTWVGSTDDSSPYYGGQAVSASEYDDENPNYLI